MRSLKETDFATLVGTSNAARMLNMSVYGVHWLMRHNRLPRLRIAGKALCTTLDAIQAYRPKHDRWRARKWRNPHYHGPGDDKTVKMQEARETD